VKDWPSLPFKIKIYISTVVVAAIPILWHALIVVTSSPLKIGWLILTLYSLISVALIVVLPSLRSGVTIGDAFVMSICMLFGIDTAIVANTLYISFLTLLLKRRHDTPAHRIVFNIATAVINVWLYGAVFKSLSLLLHDDKIKILLPTIGLAVTFYLSNSIFIATAIALSTNANPYSVWRENYAPLVLEFMVSGGAAAFIAFFPPLLWPDNQIGAFVGPLLLAPFVAVLWQINRVSKAKAEEAERHLKEQEGLYFRTVETLALAVDAKDQTTYGHIRRVRAYALGLAKLCGVTDANELKAIETGSLLHDIGKLAVEDYILNKPGRLNRQEFEKMKIHATAGDEILQQVQFPFPVAKCVRCHHERWDGSGYPDGLKGEEIPVGARILSIADSFDAIRSTRPYKSAFGIDDSVELLSAQAGSSYDPKLVHIFIEHIEDLEAQADEAARNFSELSFRKFFEKIEDTEEKVDVTLGSQTVSTVPSEELVKLFEFCGGVGRSLSLDDSLPIIARRLTRIVPYDTCVVYIPQNDDSIKAEFSCGEHANALKGTSIGLGKGISGWVAAYKRPMLNTSPALEFHDLPGDFGSLKDGMAVPLLQDADCVGVLALYATVPAFFSKSHLSLLQSVAEQIAMLVSDAAAGDRSDEKALLDPLTGIHRFAYLTVACEQLLAHARKTESPLSLLYLEIRNFLHSVSLYGTGSGDLMLRKVADVLRSELRQTDILVRYGHDGFVALLPGLGNSQASRFVQRLQQQIKGAPVNLAPGNTFFVTCHAGIASFPNDGTSLLALLQAAQKAVAEQVRLSSPQASGPEGNVLEFPPRT
jgi:diguanylate cyclase (GGDEF)-like protein/putative nucleotidyltransferase with HDIG domain